MRRKTCFRPCKTPRFLRGQVSCHTLVADLREYNAHRYKVFSAKARVNTSPPKMNPYGYIDNRKLRCDAERIAFIDKENKELLKKINTINRTIGIIDSYNPQAYESKSKWDAHVKKMKKIAEHNKTVYRKIKSAGSLYNRKFMNEFWSEVQTKLTLSSRYPLVIFEKESQDTVIGRQPSISQGLEKLSERPICFLEFQVVNGPKLGRVEIELYHDHVPVTVQNFLSICSSDNTQGLSYKKCLVHRIVPGRFLETGDITLGTGRGGMSIYGDTFPEESHRLKHTKAGVLSMVRVSKHDNNSRFCITFASMESLDKQNVVFGRIIKGIENLLKIEGYGRRVGKPLLPVIISECGNLKSPPGSW